MSHYFAGSPSQAVLNQRGKGRTKGSLNKTHATVRWGLGEAYRRLGGVDGLVEWGREHQTEFYQLLGRLIPAEIADQHGVGETKIQVMILPADSSRAQSIPSVEARAGTVPEQIGTEDARVDE